MDIYVCICVHIYIYTHTYKYVLHIYLSIYMYTHVCMYSFIHSRLHSRRSRVSDGSAMHRLTGVMYRKGVN